MSITTQQLKDEFEAVYFKTIHGESEIRPSTIAYDLVRNSHNTRYIHAEVELEFAEYKNSIYDFETKLLNAL